MNSYKGLLHFACYYTFRLAFSSVVPNHNFYYTDKFFMFSLFAFCDYLVAQSTSHNYLLYSLFAPLDQTSLENTLLVFLTPHLLKSDIINIFNLSEIIILMLQSQNSGFINPEKQLPHYYYSHYPSLNIVWFYHINIDHQFTYLTYHCYSIIREYICNNTDGRDTFLILLLKPRATFQNYLLCLHDTQYLSIFFTIYICHSLYNYQFHENTIVNTNFMMGISLMFCILFLITKVSKKLEK